ncbi:MAG: SDR family NAD(P)-dependent oxidoreductase, partial [Candidatus Omnitrophica bacterium]|nr:SDR family NAD(P)-dependent oxidoreductase [Candidatus Omnitrophota bacterium]
MDLKNKKVLVTGAEGFIGSHLVERLINEGAKVRAFIHYNSRSDWGMLEMIPEKTKKKIEVFPGDTRDPFLCQKATENVDVVFHL